MPTQFTLWISNKLTVFYFNFAYKDTDAIEKDMSNFFSFYAFHVHSIHWIYSYGFSVPPIRIIGAKPWALNFCPTSSISWKRRIVVSGLSFGDRPWCRVKSWVSFKTKKSITFGKLTLTSLPLRLTHPSGGNVRFQLPLIVLCHPNFQPVNFFQAVSYTENYIFLPKGCVFTHCSQGHVEHNCSN